MAIFIVNLRILLIAFLPNQHINQTQYFSKLSLKIVQQPNPSYDNISCCRHNAIVSFFSSYMSALAKACISTVLPSQIFQVVFLVEVPIKQGDRFNLGLNLDEC